MTPADVDPDFFTGPIDDPRRYVVSSEALAGGITGGEGLVYCARDKRDGRRVALKMLTAVPFDDFERVQARAAALADLTHANLMTHVEVFVGPALSRNSEERADPQDFDVIYAVADWVDGQTLAEVGDSADIAAALAYVSDIGRALGYLHGVRSIHAPNGIVHRDVKPSNIRIDPDGRPVLLDFGLARPVTDEMTRGAGTYKWRAPEVLSGSADQGVAIDAWGLGAVAHWILVGEPPELDGAAASRERMLASIRSESLRDRAGVVRHVERLLESSPPNRPANLRQWSSDLDDLMAGSRLKRRRRFAIAATAALSTLTLVGTLGAVSGPDATEASSSPATTLTTTTTTTTPFGPVYRGDLPDVSSDLAAELVPVAEAVNQAGGEPVVDTRENLRVTDAFDPKTFPTMVEMPFTAKWRFGNWERELQSPPCESWSSRELTMNGFTGSVLTLSPQSGGSRLLIVLSYSFFDPAEAKTFFHGKTMLNGVSENDCAQSQNLSLDLVHRDVQLDLANADDWSSWVGSEQADAGPVSAVAIAVIRHGQQLLEISVTGSDEWDAAFRLQTLAPTVAGVVGETGQ